MAKKKITDFYDQKVITKFFLACELRSNAKKKDFWNIIEPFAYDIEPAYVKGLFGRIAYDPDCYAIVAFEGNNFVIGYSMTITNADTISLMDKMKGFNGEFNFSLNHRVQTTIYNETSSFDGWCYILSDESLNSYRQIEQIQYGLWDDDAVLFDFLDALEDKIK